ncbi:MAG: hypothetical protein WDM89_20030 [Rhizomicrobium sp.]
MAGPNSDRNNQQAPGVFQNQNTARLLLFCTSIEGNARQNPNRRRDLCILQASVFSEPLSFGGDRAACPEAAPSSRCSQRMINGTKAFRFPPKPASPPSDNARFFRHKALRPVCQRSHDVDNRSLILADGELLRFQAFGDGQPVRFRFERRLALPTLSSL